MDKKFPVSYVARMLLLAWLGIRQTEEGYAWTFDHGEEPRIPAGSYAVVKVEICKVGGEPKETKPNAG